MFSKFLRCTLIGDFNVIKQRINLLNTKVKYLNAQRDYSSESNIIQSPYSDVILPKLPLHNYIWENINKWPNATAIVSKH